MKKRQKDVWGMVSCFWPVPVSTCMPFFTFHIFTEGSDGKEAGLQSSHSLTTFDFNIRHLTLNTLFAYILYIL